MGLAGSGCFFPELFGTGVSILVRSEKPSSQRLQVTLFLLALCILCLVIRPAIAVTALLSREKVSNEDVEE